MRTLRSATPFVLITLAVVACGGGDKSSTPAAEPAASTPAPAAAASPVAAASPAGAEVAAAGTPGDLKLGAEKYAICQTCHQADGKGVAGAFPPLAGSEWVTGNPGIPIRIVLHGLQGEITVAGTKYNAMMMPWKDAMSDADVAAVLTYERNSWGNKASPITAEQVAAIRKETASRTTQWTVAELKSVK
jgi:mono/diheme cytochrome c family protein